MKGDLLFSFVFTFKLVSMFPDVPEHATKLQRLSQNHIKQQVAISLCFSVYVTGSLKLSLLLRLSRFVYLQDQSETQSQDVKKLFEEYNKTVLHIITF